MAQTVPVAEDLASNLKQHLELAAIAADTGAGTVVFPELSLTGYELARAPELALAPDDRRLSPLDELARERGVNLVVGAPVRAGERRVLAALIVSPAGRAVYAKRRLGAFSPRAAVDGRVPPPESSVFAPGEDDPLFEIDGATAALAVCADVGDPQHARRAAERGATHLFASMFVVPSEYDGEARVLERMARSHRMVVAMANFGGPSGGLVAAGRSAIWAADGRRVAVAPAEGAAVVIAHPENGGLRGELRSPPPAPC